MQLQRGLSANEKLGLMNVSYIFSAPKIYSVNPVSDEYVVGAHSSRKSQFVILQVLQVKELVERSTK